LADQASTSQERENVEKINYTVFTIGDKRAWNVVNIKAHMTNMNDVNLHTVIGLTETDEYLEKLDIRIIAPRATGEIGVFLSVLNACQWAVDNQQPILTIEDDALINPNFEPNLRYFLEKLPADTDFFSLFLPRDHADQHFFQGVFTDEYGYIMGVGPSYHDGGHPDWQTDSPEIYRAYQRYGGVSMYYTVQGAQNILDIVRHDGIYDQYDNVLYANSKIGRLNGYTTHPRATELLAIVGGLESTTHDTEMYYP
jgi:GR25 family glycosyltransferase involved in LPS biosynthesis